MEYVIVSDLHFEFHADGGAALTSSLPGTEGIIVAGDLSSASGLKDALLLLLNKYKEVVFVCGNHEFYGSSVKDLHESLYRLQNEVEKTPNIGNLHILNNTTTTIEGQRFIGTTLWFPELEGIRTKHNFLSDFYQIKNASDDLYRENKTAVAFLSREIRSDDVVITHHLPSYSSVHPQWAASPYNCFFVCDLTEFIEDRQPKVWIHGHTHSSMDYKIGNTRVFCNPFGYALREENFRFDSNKILKLPA